MTQRYALALDIHDAPDTLIDEAVRWVIQLGGTLDLLYVDEYRYNTYLVPDPAVQAVLDEQWARLQESNEARLEELVTALPASVRGVGVYRVGRAEHEILELCPNYRALLIGTHGRRGLQHALLGSVAERVIRRSPRPVVVLRCEHPQAQE